jgi:exopolysaccharide biosynthesis predicted pyruvyltransferase EpsI
MTGVEIVVALQARLDAEIGSYARAGDPYSLIDFPYYANVGDSAVWLGALAALRRITGRPPVHVAGIERGGLFGLEQRLGDGTIYISGGGNFGDLWPTHQAYREAVMARFPSNRIVQLPQSIFFRSEEAVRRSADAIRRHGDFHLLVRDRASEIFARQQFDCAVHLAPDCAFGLGPLMPVGDPMHALVALMRIDQERSRADHRSIYDLRPHVVDWIREPVLPIAGLKLAACAGRMLARAGSREAVTHRFVRVAERRLTRGVLLLSSGRQAVTDRLHGHILCVLLGIPHVALDNSYGKVGACHRDWTCRVDTARFAADGGSALAALTTLPKRLAAGSRSGLVEAKRRTAVFLPSA